MPSRFARTRRLMSSPVATVIVTAGLLSAPLVASTFSFAGLITTVTKDTSMGGDRELRHGALATATSTITMQDYTNNPASWVDRPMSWSVYPTKTATMLNGRFVAPQTFVNALSEGAHGYFYESIFLDMYVTPNFHYGDIISHDADAQSVTMYLWRTQREYHYPEALDTEFTFSYDDTTQFQLEGEPVSREVALDQSGGVVQVHPPRGQTILVETADAAFDPSVIPLKGGRGDANGRCRNAVFVSHEPGRMVFQTDDGETVEITQNGRPGRIVLDGKLTPERGVMLKPGRSAALGYYRGDNSPLMVFMRTMHDEIAGEVVSVSGDQITLRETRGEHAGREHQITIAADAVIHHNGVAGQLASVIEAGQQVRVFPARPQTINTLLQRDHVIGGSRRKPKIIAEGYRPVAAFRGPQRVIGSQTLTFDASSSYAIDGEIASYAWDFGDGTTATGAVVSHTFAADQIGRFEVKLTVTDQRDLNREVRRHVVVVPGLKPADRASSDGLASGFAIQSWTGLDLNRDARNRIEAEGPSAVMQGEPSLALVTPSFGATKEAFPEGNQFRRPCANRVTGFVHAPADGWYVIGAYLNTRLWLGDEAVLDGTTDADKRGQRTWVYLAEGLHAMRLEAVEEYGKTRFTWMHLDGERVVPAGTTEGDESDRMWQTYRPAVAQTFHAPAE